MKLLILLLVALSLISSTFTAKVIRISDGDTIVVITENREQIKIRLEGIDCPESNQDFGTKARQAATNLCFNREVRVEKSGEDQYGRTLAFVYIGKLCVNEELLRLGMAWHYKKYNKDPLLSQLEINARTGKIGLWANPNPEAPWVFRRK